MKAFGVKLDMLVTENDFVFNMKTASMLSFIDKFEEQSMTNFCKQLFSNELIKIVILEESESIFEPKGEDFGISKYNTTVVFDDDERDLRWYEPCSEFGDVYTPHDAQIIMRDNKHFFHPEVESIT